ncbi:DUF1059 domain-containing protein [Muriicola soli]|uniref:DUF1059 domain-containing protein n=1 Tax=Muriicola soli TaxID=2507538 RepID=A0A411E8N0_9FLAO|nr:DUF1059 domain-containing protein [Muriicola soli]QBA64032.1 DUF1059 domain-containing protein [Muriicola soli]
MKSMTCRQLAGACDLVFYAETFEDIASQSKKHGMEMFQKGDKAHLAAMKEMKSKMKTPDDFDRWMKEKRKEFDALPDS